MFWGEFLVEKKLITDDQLFEALSIQSKTQRSYAEIIFSEKIISRDEIFKLMNLSLQKKEDVITIARTHKILSEDQISKVLTIFFKEQQSLGSILIQKWNLSSSQLMNLYSEYVESYPRVHKRSRVEKPACPIIDSKKKEKNESSIKADIKSTDFKEESIINEATLESLRELGNFDESILKPRKSEFSDYISLFDKEKYKKFYKLISIIIDISYKGDKVSNFFNSLFKEFCLLNSSLEKVESAPLSKNIIDNFESIFMSLMSKDNQFLSNIVDQYISMFTDAIDLLWNLRCEIEEKGHEPSGDEAVIWKEKNSEILSFFDGFLKDKVA